MTPCIVTLCLDFTGLSSGLFRLLCVQLFHFSIAANVVYIFENDQCDEDYVLKYEA